ncbi:MAG: hypothetical protein GEV28_24790 [Actinophytocola sp.]|uniref:hypothetical protein n=1 Tax=Actinophytocola sp. TaxID=1872138 RepID=UPI001327275E|nr:hypothetical protein [Actinophytocola sp.]MPZ83433.1 hypothetical protein [Actinophytocola sp.]
MSGAGPWLLASISPVFAILGVVIGARMTNRRELTKLTIEQEERLRARRQEAYSEFYALIFGAATAVMEDYEVGVLKEVPVERFHDSLRLRAVIGLLGPEEVSRRVEGVLATLSGLYTAAKDPSEHADVPLIAVEVRREVDELLGSMEHTLTQSVAPPVVALPWRARGLRRAGRPA